MRIMGPSRIAILGAGEFGKQAAHYILHNDRNIRRYEIVGWYDDTIAKGKTISEIPVLGKVDSVIEDFNSGIFENIFIAIGYNHPDFKETLIKKYKGKIPLFNIISPNAYIDPTSDIGENVFIYPGAIIDKETVLEDGVTVNLGSIVSHNSTIGACGFIAPGATVAGFSKVGKCSFVGAGTTIIDNITICENVRLGAGCVVVSDITSAGLYIGIPAKKYK